LAALLAGSTYSPEGHISSVIPAKAGIQDDKQHRSGFWIPAFAGMTAVM